MQSILLWMIYFYWIIPFILCCLLTGCKKHFIMHTDCSRDNQTQTKSRENVSIVRLQWQGKPNLSPWCLTNFCEGNLIQILMTKTKKKLYYLARDKGFAIVFKRLKWTSAGKNCTTLQLQKKSRSRVIKHPLYVEILNKAKTGCELILP